MYFNCLKNGPILLSLFETEGTNLRTDHGPKIQELRRGEWNLIL